MGGKGVADSSIQPPSPLSPLRKVNLLVFAPASSETGGRIIRRHRKGKKEKKREQEEKKRKR